MRRTDQCNDLLRLTLIGGTQRGIVLIDFGLALRNYWVEFSTSEFVAALRCFGWRKAHCTSVIVVFLRKHSGKTVVHPVNDLFM